MTYIPCNSAFLDHKTLFLNVSGPKAFKKARNLRQNSVYYINRRTFFGERVRPNSATLTYIQTMKEYTNQTVTLYFWTYGMAGLVLNALLNDI